MRRRDFEVAGCFPKAFNAFIRDQPGEGPVAPLAADHAAPPERRLADAYLACGTSDEREAIPIAIRPIDSTADDL